MADLKISIENLAAIEAGLEEFKDTLAPFIEATKEANVTLDRIREATQNLKALDQDRFLRLEPIARIVSEIETTTDAFSGYVQEKASLTDRLRAFSPDISSYAGSVASAGTTVTNLVKGAHYTALAYEPASLSFPEPASPPLIEIHRTDAINEEQVLEGLLKEVDPVLVQKRRGAWEAFQGSYSDRISQATHSMREAIRILLDKLAPEEKIKSAPWYIPDKTSQSGITRKQRIRYALQGPNRECSESLLKLGRALYDNLSHEAHSDNEPHELRKRNVELFLSMADDFLRIILLNRYRGG